MKRSWTTLIVLILYAIFINSTVSEQQLLPLWLDEDEPVEVHDVKNDKITIVWQLPTEIANMTTKQRLMAFVLTSSTIVGRNSMTVNLNETERSYTFDNLVGNTTYRVSVEAFREDESLWYGSNMATTSLAALDWLPPPTELQLNDKTEDSLEISWAPPDVSQSGTSVIINQYLINFFEFYPSTQTFTKKISVNVPIPKTSYLAARLNRGSVYNVTIQAGTSYGYGNMAWSVYNTLPNNASTHTLKLKAKAPNSLLLAWPATWMSTPNAKFTIKAKTLHSMDGVDKEYMNSGFIEVGKPAEFLIKNLSPGSTYNVTISTPAEPEKSRGKWGRPIRMKSSWAVFSTLIQGEYTVSEARIVVETDSAASIVFQPLQVHGVVSYQFRYAPVEEDSNFPVIETRELHDEELKCPKFGCEWRCHLFFNLLRRPREYTFSIRANVDGHWNKWVQVQRRPWNLLERVCSINPPTSFVDNIGKLDHQRLIDLQNAPGRMSTDAWRFLVVVDSRYSKIASIDMTKLADKATADFDHIPYYISASLTPDEVDDFKDFKIGDGKVYGGYLNYPLLDPENDPQWTLVPMGQQENEIMEPRLRTCGFTEQGAFECDMAFSEVFNYIPGWVKIATAVLFVLLTFACCMGTTCFCRKCCANKSKSKESTSLYYHNSSPHHSFVTQEYRRVDQREFTLDQDSERRIFLDYLE